MSAVAEIPVDIPVRKYVKRWLLYHNHGTDLFRAGTNNDIALVIFSLLSNKPYAFRADVVKQEYPESIRLMLGHDFTRGGNFFFDERMLRVFNDWVKDQLLREVVNTMEVARVFVPNFQRKQAVLDLMAKYEIEEDEWAFETIIKNLQRRGEKYALSFENSDEARCFLPVGYRNWMRFLFFDNQGKELIQQLNAQAQKENCAPVKLMEKVLMQYVTNKNNFADNCPTVE